MGRKKRVVGKIIWGPRKSHMKENGMVSKSTFIDTNESDKFCLCVYVSQWYVVTSVLARKLLHQDRTILVDSWNSRFYIYIQSSYTSLWDQQMAKNAQDARFEFSLPSSVHMLCCVTLTMLYNFVYKAKYIILLSITDGSFYVDNSNWYGAIVIRDINSSYNNDNVI